MGLGEGPGEDGEGVASFEDVGTHGSTHHPCSDPADPGLGRAHWLHGGGDGGHGLGVEESESSRKSGSGRGSVEVLAEEREWAGQWTR